MPKDDWIPFVGRALCPVPANAYVDLWMDNGDILLDVPATQPPGSYYRGQSGYMWGPGVPLEGGPLHWEACIIQYRLSARWSRHLRYAETFDLIRRGKLDRSAPRDPNPIRWKPNLSPDERLR